MRSYKITALLIALFVVGWVSTAVAQYDDLYYDPDTDATYYDYSTNNTTTGDTYAYNDEYDYDDDDYEYYEDDYDYQYTSRIRRFHRPYYGFDYYDPVYVDMYYYDPFINPGMTVLIYDTPYRWNRWNRWNSWNAWGPSVSFNVYSGWGWNRYNNWNRWNNWGYNNYYDPWGPSWNNWGYNNYYGGGFYSNYYCPPSWGNNYNYVTVNNINNINNLNSNSNGTYYGPRTNGGTTRPNNSRRDIGIAKPGSKDVTPLNADRQKAQIATSNPKQKQSPADVNRSGKTVIKENGATVRANERTDKNKATIPNSNLSGTDRTRSSISPSNSGLDRSRVNPNISTSPDRNKQDSYNNPRTQPKRDYTRPPANTRSNDRSRSTTPRTYERNNSRSNSSGYDNNSSRNRSNSSSGYNSNNNRTKRNNSGYSSPNRSNRSNSSGYNNNTSRNRSNSSSGYNNNRSNRSNSGYSSPNRGSSRSNSGVNRSNSSSRSSSGINKSSSRSSSPSRSYNSGSSRSSNSRSGGSSRSSRGN